jgi:hypothetical protein
MNYTHHELERISYIQGTGQAPLYEELDEKESLEERMGDAATHIQEAKGSFPKEDFLQELIDQCRAMSKGRVTMAEVAEFCKDLEELQDEVSRQTDYGLDELAKAERLLDA